MAEFRTATRGYEAAERAARERPLVLYLRMARLDHWPKNVFVALGVLLAAFYRPESVVLGNVPEVFAAFVVACLVASSNYVLNELLDAPTDRFHPTKRLRPAAAGLVDPMACIALWLALGMFGISAALLVSRPLAGTAAVFWLMGCVYNVSPVRAKDLPYVDVLVESVNNPLRLLMGWFALVPGTVPPLSLVLAYWMAGAFFMAAKRLAEYREIADPAVAATYRRSFRHYDETRLHASTAAYLTGGALFLGIFVVRYKLELILVAPVFAALAAHYLAIALRPGSPAAAPERLWRERALGLHALVAVALFAALMFVEVPALYELFRVDPAGAEPLWRIGR